MKNNSIPHLIIFALIVMAISACVRPASGSPVKVPTQSAGISNPVSTQSQIMKEIIAGTQTAMALASSGGTPQATVAAGTQVNYSSGTNTPAWASPTPGGYTTTIYPTQTPGPPPIVVPTYISGAYNPSANKGAESFIIIKVVRDLSVTIQTENFPPNMNHTVRMGQYGTLGINGIIVGFTNFANGGVLTATYSIPDALRGSSQIAIRLEGESQYFSYNYFDNINYP